MQGSNVEKRRGLGGCFVPVLLGLLGMLATSQAQPSYTLSSLNATVNINAGGLAGMNNWLVDGVNQVKGQWFYYRIGDLSANQSIDAMGNLSASQGSANTLTLTYSDLPSSPDYSARVDYNLTGSAAGSGQASLGETVTFYNYSANSLVLRFFDYADFDIGGNPGGQSVTMSQTSFGPPTAPVYTTHFTQSLGAFSVTSSTASGSFGNSGMEANDFSTTLQTITNGTPSNLNGVLTAAGDVTAAAEWEVTLAPGKSLQLSKTFTISVPEPSSVAVLGLGLVSCLLGRRRGTRG